MEILNKDLKTIKRMNDIVIFDAVNAQLLGLSKQLKNSDIKSIVFRFDRLDHSGNAYFNEDISCFSSYPRGKTPQENLLSQLKLKSNAFYSLKMDLDIFSDLPKLVNVDINDWIEVHENGVDFHMKNYVEMNPKETSKIKNKLKL
jgi:hypothetical protein